MNNQTSGISILDIKRKNRQNILELLKQNGPMSRKDIAQELRLTPAAVTIIVTNLIEDGILYEKGSEINTEKITRGRKKILLDINYNVCYTFGVYLDKSYISVGLCNLKGDLIATTKIPNPHSTNYLKKAQNVYSAAMDILAETLVNLRQVIGIGVALDSDIEDENLVQQILMQKFGLPVVIENNMKALLHAEIDLFRERYMNCQDIFFLSYIDDIRGINRIGGQVCEADPTRYGHFIVDPDGRVCSCGRKGCINTLAKRSCLIQDVQKIYSKEKTPALYEITDGYIERITMDTILDAGHLGDQEIAKLLYAICQKLCLLIANIIVISNPQKIIIYGTSLRTELSRQYIIKHVSSYLHMDVSNIIVRSAVNEDTRAIAGANVAARKLFYEFGGVRSSEDIVQKESAY